MNLIQKDILIIFYWAYIESGTPHEKTPLFLGVYDLEPIEDVVTDFYKIPKDEAQKAIESAKKEVTPISTVEN